MKSKKIKRIFIIVAAAVLAVTAAMFVVSANFVYVGGEWFKRNSADVEINLIAKDGGSLSRLGKFRDMETLSLSGVSDKNTLGIPKMNGVETLSVMVSEVGDAAFLNNFESIVQLHVFMSAVDFENSANVNVKSLDLISCGARNFEQLAKSETIKELTIFQSNFDFDGEFIEKDMISNDFDSRVLAEFDSVTSVELSNMRVNDIGGFLEMKSLEKLTVKRYDLDEPPLTEEQADELRKAGIEVTIDNEKFEL